MTPLELSVPRDTLLALYCLLILLASLAGGWVPLWVRLTHQRMQLAISLVAGFMLGVSLLHLLPHAHAALQSIDAVVAWMLIGLLAMFFIERFFCFHHHDPPDSHEPPAPSPAHAINAPSDHAQTNTGVEAVQPGCHPHPAAEAHHHHKLTWSGAAVGLTLHSLIAGVALAASYHDESVVADPSRFPAAGLTVFLMIILHKPFDSLTLGTLLAAGHWSIRTRHLVNGLFALAIPVGVVLYDLSATTLTAHIHDLEGPALAFSAGTFLCIALSDLLPELQFHQHDRVKLSTAMLLGLVIAWVIHFAESNTHRQHHPTPHGHTDTLAPHTHPAEPHHAHEHGPTDAGP